MTLRKLRTTSTTFLIKFFGFPIPSIPSYVSYPNIYLIDQRVFSTNYVTPSAMDMDITQDTINNNTLLSSSSSSNTSFTKNKNHTTDNSSSIPSSYTLEEAKTILQSIKQQYPQLLTSSPPTTNSLSSTNPTPTYSLAIDTNYQQKITNLLNYTTSSITSQTKGFQFDKYRMRYIALHIAYIGKNYYGFASQETGGGDLIDPTLLINTNNHSTDTTNTTNTNQIPSYGTVQAKKRARIQSDNNNSNNSSLSSSSTSKSTTSNLVTVESVLFAALQKACLVDNRDNCGYTRCGRTDRGVSAGGQVISLRIRSKANRYDIPNEKYDSISISPNFHLFRTNSSSALIDYGTLSNNELLLTNLANTIQNDSTLSPLWVRNNNQIMNTGDEFPIPSNEHDYCFILNNILPPDIRVLGWSDIPEDFSARFSATTRTYRYYFLRRDLNLSAMRQAGLNLVGIHDYRNICKIDVQNTQNFIREILSIRIVNASYDTTDNNTTKVSIPQYLQKHIYEATGCTSAMDPTSPSDITPSGKLHTITPKAKLETSIINEDSNHDSPNPRSLYYIEVVGRAFLWHQIRCVAGLLFLVGRGAETPDTIKELLNITKYPARPQYNMASEDPLILYHCSFGEEEIHNDNKNNMDISNTIHHNTDTTLTTPTEENNEEERRYRFLRSYSPLHLQWNHSINSLRRLTLELEKEWSKQIIHSELLKSILDRIYSITVDENEVKKLMDKNISINNNDNNNTKDMKSWAEILDKYSNLRYREYLQQQLEQQHNNTNHLTTSSSSSPLTTEPLLLSLADAEYNIVGLNKPNTNNGNNSTNSKNNYIPLSSRATGKSIEEKWNKLSESKKSSILLIHPTNAPKLLKEFTNGNNQHNNDNKQNNTSNENIISSSVPSDK